MARPPPGLCRGSSAELARASSHSVDLQGCSGGPAWVPVRNVAAMLSALGIYSAAFLFRDGFHFLSFRAGSVYGISHGFRLHRKSAAVARRYRLTFCACFPGPPTEGGDGQRARASELAAFCFEIVFFFFIQSHCSLKWPVITYRKQQFFS